MGNLWIREMGLPVTIVLAGFAPMRPSIVRLPLVKTTQNLSPFAA
jgi:hypothetical protein